MRAFACSQTWNLTSRWVSWKQRPLRPQNLGSPKLRPAGHQCDWKLSIDDKKNSISTSRYFNAFTRGIWLLQSFMCRNIFMQRIVLKNVFVFCCEGKILLTLFGDGIFHLMTLKNISVASWPLPRKSYFGPWVSQNIVWLKWSFHQIDSSLSLETSHNIFFLHAVSMKPSRSLPEATQKAKTKHSIVGSWNCWKHSGAKCWLHCVDYNCLGAINSNVTFLFYLNYFLWKLKTSKRQGVSSLLETKHEVFLFKRRNQFLKLCQSKTLLK